VTLKKPYLFFRVEKKFTILCGVLKKTLSCSTFHSRRNRRRSPSLYLE